MLSKLKLLIILGTRPEAIKLAPIILEAKKHSHIETVVCSTGQHREMLAQVFSAFDIKADIELDIMEPNQTLAGMSSKMINILDKVLEEQKPDWIIVQGDTTTVFTASLVAFYRKIKIAHIEAGLRTGDIYSPFPEEMNRRFCDLIADRYFTPTKQNTKNLLAENISHDKIIETGNSVIDALLFMKNKIKHNESLQKDILEKLKSFGFHHNPHQKLILITGHRRENFGSAIENICLALKELALSYPDCQFLYPVHLNPNVQKPVNDILQNVTNITLIPPVDYSTMIYLMINAYFIITDSGGIQEEAPSLKKPLLITRESTERPEVLTYSKAKLVGSSKDKLILEAKRLLELSDIEYQNFTHDIENPFGDGTASQRTIENLK